MIEPIVYKWQEYNWIALPMAKKHSGDDWEVHDLNIDHPAARYIDNEPDARMLAAAPLLLKACIEMAEKATCTDPLAWDRLHAAIKAAGRL